jgi:hypothetical protein
VPRLEARFALACSPLSLFAWAEPNRAGVLLPFLAVGPSEPSHRFPAFPRVRMGRPRAQLWPCVPPSLVLLTGGTRRSAASSIPTRDRAGVEHGVLRSNPEFYGILLQVKVSWGYLSKPHTFAHLFYKRFWRCLP